MGRVRGPVGIHCGFVDDINKSRCVFQCPVDGPRFFFSRPIRELLRSVCTSRVYRLRSTQHLVVFLQELACSRAQEWPWDCCCTSAVLPSICCTSFNSIHGGSFLCTSCVPCSTQPVYPACFVGNSCYVAREGVGVTPLTRILHSVTPSPPLLSMHRFFHIPFCCCCCSIAVSSASSIFLRSRGMDLLSAFCLIPTYRYDLCFSCLVLWRTGEHIMSLTSLSQPQTPAGFVADQLM